VSQYEQASDDGHAFLNNSIAVWEQDVFAFLDARLKN
jgi:hypothetical protein